MNGIGERIRARREKLGWSTVKLATLAGIAQSFLWRIENGQATGSWETYTKIAGALGISIEALFPNASNIEDAPLGSRRIPLLDYVQAGRWTGVNSSMVDAEMMDYVTTDLEYPPSAFALRIRGDSMEPRFREGDTVVIDPTIQPRPGDFVVARDDSGEGATFKEYRAAGVNEHGAQVFELHPLNPRYAPIRSDRQPVAIVGVMVEHTTYRRK